MLMSLAHRFSRGVVSQSFNLCARPFDRIHEIKEGNQRHPVCRETKIGVFRCRLEQKRARAARPCGSADCARVAEATIKLNPNVLHAKKKAMRECGSQWRSRARCEAQSTPRAALACGSAAWGRRCRVREGGEPVCRALRTARFRVPRSKERGIRRHDQLCLSAWVSSRLRGVAQVRTDPAMPRGSV